MKHRREEIEVKFLTNVVSSNCHDPLEYSIRSIFFSDDSQTEHPNVSSIVFDRLATMKSLLCDSTVTQPMIQIDEKRPMFFV